LRIDEFSNKSIVFQNFVIPCARAHRRRKRLRGACGEAPLKTVVPDTLTVGAAIPDPPFETSGGVGLDIDLTRAIADELSLAWRLVRYAGSDFNGIFAGLGHDFDLVASGATITPERERLATFCAPYLVSGQGLAADPARTPDLRSIADLAGRTLGVQDGNTSQPIAEKLHATGRLGAVRTYPYHAIGAMLDDLAAGRIDAVMKLAPVLRWLLRDRPVLALVETGITQERIALAVAPGAADLHAAIDAAQARLDASGRIAALRQRWIDP
jgi:polar amino acid transport system substrate-binding protein